MPLPSDVTSESAHDLSLRLSGFSEKANAERMLEIACSNDPHLFAELKGVEIAPVLGGISMSYDILAALGIISLPAGVISSYIASIIFQYLHSNKTKDRRIQLIIERDATRLFIFIDRETSRSETETQIKDIIEQLWFTHDPK